MPKSLDVLLVGASDLNGGAARAAYRLHQGLKSSSDVRSRFLVQDRDSDDPTVLAPQSSARKVIDKTRARLGDFLSRAHLGQSAVNRSVNLLPSGLHRRINALDPDIVHLHWIGQETISIKEIGKIEAPIVWTLHDMWGFQGTRHYSGNSKEIQPELSPQDDSRELPKRGAWIDRWVSWWKLRHWDQLDISVVTPSKWLGREARQSRIFGENPIRVIPNGIDTSMYKPIDRAAARSVFQLPQDVPLVLFGAVNALTNPRKGPHLLRSALKKLLEWKTDVELVVFGASESAWDWSEGVFEGRIHAVGHLSDDYSLLLLYSASDVFALPSMQDNLPNTIMEALACGTPSVGFRVGGIPEMIDHRTTGYVAEPFDTDEFATGLDWVLDSGRHEDLCKASRRKATDEYALPDIAQRHVELYHEIAR